MSFNLSPVSSKMMTFANLNLSRFPNNLTFILSSHSRELGQRQSTWSAPWPRSWPWTWTWPPVVRSQSHSSRSSRVDCACASTSERGELVLGRKEEDRFWFMEKGRAAGSCAFPSLSVQCAVRALMRTFRTALSVPPFFHPSPWSFLGAPLAELRFRRFVRY